MNTQTIIAMKRPVEMETKKTMICAFQDYWKKNEMKYEKAMHPNPKAKQTAQKYSMFPSSIIARTSNHIMISGHKIANGRYFT